MNNSQGWGEIFPNTLCKFSNNQNMMDRIRTGSGIANTSNRINTKFSMTFISRQFLSQGSPYKERAFKSDKLISGVFIYHCNFFMLPYHLPSREAWKFSTISQLLNRLICDIFRDWKKIPIILWTIYGGTAFVSFWRSHCPSVQKDESLTLFELVPLCLRQCNSPKPF